MDVGEGKGMMKQSSEVEVEDEVTKEGEKGKERKKRHDNVSAAK